MIITDEKNYCIMIDGAHWPYLQPVQKLHNFKICLN